VDPPGIGPANEPQSNRRGKNGHRRAQHAVGVRHGTRLRRKVTAQTDRQGVVAVRGLQRRAARRRRSVCDIPGVRVDEWLETALDAAAMKMCGRCDWKCHHRQHDRG
jgi:hypothetical protein